MPQLHIFPWLDIHCMKDETAVGASEDTLRVKGGNAATPPTSRMSYSTNGTSVWGISRGRRTGSPYPNTEIVQFYLIKYHSSHVDPWLRISILDLVQKDRNTTPIPSDLEKAACLSLASYFTFCSKAWQLTRGLHLCDVHNILWFGSPPTKFCSFPSIARELLVQLSYVKLCCKELRQVLFVMMSVFALGMEVMTSAKCGALCCYGYLSPSLLFSQEYGLCRRMLLLPGQ